MKKFRIHIFGFIFFINSIIWASVPYELDASSITYSNELIYASGGVTGVFNTAIVNADQIVVDPNNGVLQIEGNVFFEKDDLVWSGRELIYDFKKEKGDFGQVRMSLGSLDIEANKVNRSANNNFLFENIKVTTCVEEPPHYSLNSSIAFLEDNSVFKAKNVYLNLWGLPVFYIPYIKTDLKKSGVGTEFGHRDSMGPFIKLCISNYEDKNFKSLSHLHYYQKRGLAVEQQINVRNTNSDITADGIFISDNDPYYRYDSSSDKQHIDKKRYRMRLKSSKDFSDTSYVKSEWTYLSDKYFVEEFFRDDFRYYAQPETRASYFKAGKNSSLEIYLSHHLNNFYSNTDRFDINLNGYRKKIGNSSLYYQNYSSFSYLKEQKKDSDDENDIFRSITDHQLFYPSNIGIFSFVPRIGGGITYISDTLNSSADHFRYKWLIGTEFSLKASKVISNKRSWYGDGLRHVIKPYFDYKFEEHSFESSSLLYFDPHDILDNRNRVRFGLNQLIQSKRLNKTKRLSEIDVYAHYLIDEDTGDSFNRIYTDIKVNLTDNIDLDGLTIVDTNTDSIPLMISRLRYKQSNFRLSLDHFYRDQIQSLYSANIEVFPEQRFSAQGYLRYENNTHNFESAAITLFSDTCCMRYGIGYKLSRNDDHQIYLSVNLKALNN